MNCGLACIWGNWHPLAPSSMGVFGNIRTPAPALMLRHRAAGPEGRLPVPTLWDSRPREPSAAHTPPAPHVCVLSIHQISRIFIRFAHPGKWTPVTAQQMPTQDQHGLTHPNMPSALNAIHQGSAFQNNAGQIQLFLSFSLVLKFQAQRVNVVARGGENLLWREA